MKHLLVILVASLSLLGCEQKSAPPTVQGAPFAPVPDSAKSPAVPREAKPKAARLYQALLVGGKATGYYFLDDETYARGSSALERRYVQACPSLVPRAEPSCPAHRVRDGGCKRDADCVEKPRGYCASQGLGPGCGCRYGCTSDGDCKPSQICVCADPVGYCADSSCGTHGNCPAHQVCSAAPLANDVDQHGPFQCAMK